MFCPLKSMELTPGGPQVIPKLRRLRGERRGPQATQLCGPLEEKSEDRPQCTQPRGQNGSGPSPRPLPDKP